MGLFGRNLAPLVLLALAALVWFEPWIPVPDVLAEEIRDTALLRIVVGALCVFSAVLIVERRLLADQFRQVLGQLKTFHEARLAEVGGQGGADQARREAVRIMAGTLESADPAARKAAHMNLTRLVGQDLGSKPGPWREWLRENEAD